MLHHLSLNRMAHFRINRRAMKLGFKRFAAQVHIYLCHQILDIVKDLLTFRITCVARELISHVAR